MLPRDDGTQIVMIFMMKYDKEECANLPAGRQGRQQFNTQHSTLNTQNKKRRSGIKTNQTPEISL